MLRKKNFNQEFLDILFQQRNKVYGAYELRINYSRRMKKAFSLMGLVFGLAACLPFLSVSSNSVDPKVRKPTILTPIQIDTKVLPQTPPKKRSEVAKTTRTKTTTKAITYVIEKTEKLVLQPSLPDKEEFISKVPGTTTPTGKPNPGDDGGIAGGKGVQPQAPTGLPKVEDFVYNPEDFSGELPLFPGGEDALNRFLSEHTTYTASAIRQDIEGRVMIACVIDQQGVPTEVKVVRGLGFGLDEEAMRVIQSMPRWKPGHMNGHPVRVEIIIPFSFELNR